MRCLTTTVRCVCVLLLLSTMGLATEQEMRQNALRLFIEGGQSDVAGRYEDALSSFEASMAYDARLTTMWNIAVNHLKLGNGDLAAAYLDRYLQLASRHRSTLEMQQVVGAIAEAGGELADDELRRQLGARLRDADRAVSAGTASRAAGTDLRYGVRADTPETRRLAEAARNRGTELFRAGLEAASARDVNRALREFERSLAYRRISNAVYNISVCHLVLGHRDLAIRFLDWYVDNRPEVATEPRVLAVQRAIAESPEDVGDQDRRILLWGHLFDGVEQPMTITAGGSGSREVPEHLDRTLATIEESFHSTVGSNTTCFLVRVARSKDQYLMDPPSPMGPCQRRALARSLILIYNEIDQRLQSGHEPTEINGTRCIEWDRDDPLGGDLIAISPFSMLDTWSAIESEEARRCPPQRPPRSDRRPAGTPTAVITWDVSRRSGDSTSPFRRPAVTVGRDIILNGASSSDSSGGQLRYSWQLCRPSREDCETLSNPTMGRGSTNSFRVDAEGTYGVTLTVTNPSGRQDGTRVWIRTGEEVPEPDPEDIPDIPQTGPCPAMPPQERWLECAIQEPVNPARMIQGAHQILRAYRDRRLDPRFLMPHQVCLLSYDGALHRDQVEEWATRPSNDINGRISASLTSEHGDYNYDSFIIQIRTLTRNVQDSARRFMGAAGNCNEEGGRVSTSSASMVLQGWYVDQRANPRSVYSVVVE